MKESSGIEQLWRMEGELDGNVGFLPWRMTLKTTAEYPNIFGHIRTLHSAPGFQNITIMEGGLSVNCGVSRLVTLRVGLVLYLKSSSQ